MIVMYFVSSLLEQSVISTFYDHVFEHETLTLRSKIKFA